MPMLNLWLLYIIAAVTARGLETRGFSEDGYMLAPGCAHTCVAQVTDLFGCSASEACFCSSKNVTTAYTACITTHCVVPQDLLSSEKFQATTCNYPIRSRVALTRGITWALFILVTAFVSLRFLSRWKYLGGTGFGWDDYVVLFCYAMVVPMCAGSEAEVQNGLGQDMYMLDIYQVTTVLTWFFTGELLYNTIVMSTKVAVVLLYLRIWTTDSITPAFRIACWCIIAVLVATCIAFDMGIVFQCSPIHLAWTKLLGTHGTCIEMEPMIYTFGALNICYDVVVYFLPVHSLLKLHIPWRRKVGVLSVFLCGFIVTICSIVRLQYLVRIDLSKNVTWDFQYIGMWSIIEGSLATVVICMPATAGLVQRWRKSGLRGPRDTTTANGSVATQKPISEDESEDSCSPSRPAPHDLGDPEKALRQGREDAAIDSATQPQTVDETLEGQSASGILDQRRRSSNQTSPGPPGLVSSAVLYHTRSNDRGGRVEISHEAPSQPSEARLMYRDENDVLHTVIVQDIPQGRIPGPWESRQGRLGTLEGARVVEEP